jgi:hypothetical protein
MRCFLLHVYEWNNHNNFFTMARQPPSGQRPPHYREFIITLRHTTLSRTPLDEWSARRRDLYLTTNNTQNRQTSMPPLGFEPAISEIERPQTHALVSRFKNPPFKVYETPKLYRHFSVRQNRRFGKKMQTNWTTRTHLLYSFWSVSPQLHHYYFCNKICRYNIT